MATSPTTPADHATNPLALVTENFSITEPSATFTKKIPQHKQDLITAFTSTDFYIQLLFVSIALALAWLMSILIKQRLRKYFEDHPPHHIGMEIVQRSTGLITPLLAIFYVGVAKPFADDYANGIMSLSDATIQLAIAFLLSKIVLMTVQTKPVANLIAVLIMITAILKVTAFTRVTVTYLSSVALDIGTFHISLLNLINAAIILVIVFWIAGMLTRSLERFLRRSSSLSYTARELTVKFFRILFYFIAMLITLSALGVDLTAFAVFGGALGVGIGLGLQKITANFVSGITLLLEKSIKIGDLIEVANVSGNVRELNIRYALIETADGREVLIPNEELVSTRVTNWTYSNTQARIEIPVGVNYDADVNLVKRLLTEAAREHPKCLKKPEPSCFLRTFGDSSLNFLLIFWIANINDGKYAPQSEVMMSILVKFKQNNIDIPYPQRVTRVINENMPLE